MKTVLSSKAQVIDLRYLSIHDFSQYNTDIPTTNAVYRVVIPNFNKYVDIAYTPGTVMNIGANLLKLSAVYDPELLPVIPSGLYKITQSICPNDQLFKTYVFFNISPELHRLAKLVCQFNNDTAKLAQIFDLKMQFELSKILAEDCCREKEGITLFNLALGNLNLISSDCDCGYVN